MPRQLLRPRVSQPELLVILHGLLALALLSCGSGDTTDEQPESTESVVQPTTTATTSPTTTAEVEDGPSDTEPVAALWSASGVTSDAAALTFRTNSCVVAKLTLEPGGKTQATDTWPDASSGCLIDHVFFLNDLIPNTTYTVTAEMRDREGLVGEGSYNFLTEALDPGEIVVSDWEARELTPTSVFLHFLSSNCTTAFWQVNPGGHVARADEWPDASLRCFVDHNARFSELLPDTEYTVTVGLGDRHDHVQDFSYTFRTPVD